MGGTIVTATTLLFMPAGDIGFRWMRLDDETVIGQGEGVPVTDDPTVAIVPAEDVTLHWADLPDRSDAQATAAARILAGEASAAPLSELHVAVGDEGMPDRPIAVVGVGTMRNWLAMLSGAGVDPVALVPAPMLLARPDDGYARAEIAGHGVIRGANAGFADEARLTELLTGGEPPATLTRSAVIEALIASAQSPRLDLRQGPFARRRKFALDRRLIVKLGWLCLTILSFTLAIDLVRIAKYDFAADALERRADLLARTGLPRGETVNDADRQLNERLASVRGPGLGFSRSVAAIYSAVRGTPGSELTSLDFQPDGTIRVAVAVEREAVAVDLRNAIEAQGFRVEPSVFQAGMGGRITGEFTVRAP